MKIFKRILLGLLIVAVIGTLGFVVWAETPLGPAPEALQALQSDAQVTVTEKAGLIVFQPANVNPADLKTGYIFYPGGRVDARSYAVPLRQIAERGYLVALLQVRLNLAFFDVNAADRVFAVYPGIQHWALGGHSLGGVAAALYASKHTGLDGLVFWASYPADETLKNTTMKIASIYGTNDMGGMEQFDKSHALLPADVTWTIIEGGNHGQFGDYGFQPGDKVATISRADQQKQVVDATVKFLESLGK